MYVRYTSPILRSTQIVKVDWGQTDNGRYELINFIHIMCTCIYASTAVLRVLDPFFIIIIFRVTKVSAGLVIYFRTPFATSVVLFFFLYIPIFFLFFFFLFHGQSRVRRVCLIKHAVLCSSGGRTEFPGDEVKIDSAKVGPCTTTTTSLPPPPSH